MSAENIKILLINNDSSKFIFAESGNIKENIFELIDVKYYDLSNENFKELDYFNLIINFNKENILNSISKYKLVPFYNYINHSKTLNKFNLYSPEIGLYYLSEFLKPVFIVVLAFVIIGFTSKFQRNENFLKFFSFLFQLDFLFFYLKKSYQNLQ